MRANSWTPEEEAWLREAYPTHHNAELARMHAERFPDRPRRTDKAINSRAKVWNLRKAEGFVRNPPVFWTPEKDEWFRAFVPGHHESDISAEHERLFGTPLTASQIGNRKAALGVKSGTVGGRFRKGEAHGFKDEAHRRAFLEAGKATRFKKGEPQRRKGWVKPVGHERVNVEGYVEVKVSDGLQERPNCNYRMKHHVVWERAHGGPVPPNTMIVFADRDKRNFDPDNLVAVPRSLWAVISRPGIPYHDAGSLGVAVNIARVRSAANGAACRPRTCWSCGATFGPRYPGQRTCDACLAAGKHAPKRNPRARDGGEGVCAVCGAKFAKGRTTQRRCPDCIAAAPNASVRDQRASMGLER